MIKMKEEIKVEPSEELGYWIGIVQTDGSFKQYTDHDGNRQFIISFCVSTKSLPMVQKFKELSSKIFNRHCNLNQDRKRPSWYCGIGVTRLLKLFEKLEIKFGDPPVPPKWILENQNYFGAYLAGVIDGDGCVYFNKGLNRIQNRIQITSGHMPIQLANAIRQKLNCGVSIQDGKERTFHLNGRYFNGKSFDLVFNVSGKNVEFMKRYVLNYVQILHKRERLEQFVKSLES